MWTQLAQQSYRLKGLMGALLHVRVLILLSINRNIVALTHITPPQTCPPTDNSWIFDDQNSTFIAILMMIRIAHLLALVDPITLSLSIHELQKGIMSSLLSKCNKKLYTKFHYFSLWNYKLHTKRNYEFL